MPQIASGFGQNRGILFFAEDKGVGRLSQRFEGRRHEVAKQTSRKMSNRRFIPMEAALLHWLSPYRKEEGLLIPMVDFAYGREQRALVLSPCRVLCFAGREQKPCRAPRLLEGRRWQ
jgi:hypothetical protein